MEIKITNIKDENEKRHPRPNCSKCKSKFVYTLTNGIIVCRACGHREDKNENSIK